MRSIRFPFTLAQRLRKRRQFIELQRFGMRWKRGSLILLLSPLNNRSGQIGFTVSRKVGKAVMRNRIKRRLREIVRTNYQTVLAQRNYVFIALPGAAQTPFFILRKDLLWLLQTAAQSAPAVSLPS